MTKFVAFLRGINVGGNKTIAMARLKTVLEQVGFQSVKTHLNSGNVVFASRETGVAKLTKAIEGAIEREFGFRPAVVVGSSADLKRIVERNPFPKMAADDPGHLVVMFLAAKPDKDAAGRIAKAYAGPEETRIDGDAVYITYPNGIGKSKLTNVFLEKQLGVAGTARNWNTIARLAEMATAG